MVYLALTAALVYGVLNTSVGYGHEDVAGVLELVAFVGLQAGVGLLVGRRWAPALYVPAVALAVPAGRPPYLYEEQPGPIWQGMIVAAVVALPLIGLGVALRRLGPRVHAPLDSGGH